MRQHELPCINPTTHQVKELERSTGGECLEGALREEAAVQRRKARVEAVRDGSQQAVDALAALRLHGPKHALGDES